MSGPDKRSEGFSLRLSVASSLDNEIGNEMTGASFLNAPGPFWQEASGLATVQGRGFACNFTQ